VYPKCVVPCVCKSLQFLTVHYTSKGREYTVIARGRVEAAVSAAGLASESASRTDSASPHQKVKKGTNFPPGHIVHLCTILYTWDESSVGNFRIGLLIFLRPKGKYF
jgi:hypothetical protein